MNLPLKSLTKSEFRSEEAGDRIDLPDSNRNTRSATVTNEIAHTVSPGTAQGQFFVDLNENAKLTENARCITTRQDAGISTRKGEHSGVLIEESPFAVLNPTKETVRQNGRRIKDPDEPMFTLTVQDRHGVVHCGRVRRLTPRECWRLQGFTDEQFHRAAATGLSDSRLYQMAGNAVSVPVISALGRKIKEIYERGRINAESCDQ